VRAAIAGCRRSVSGLARQALRVIGEPARVAVMSARATALLKPFGTPARDLADLIHAMATRAS